MVKENNINQILEILKNISNRIDNMEVEKSWLSVSELSLYLGIKESTIYQYVYKKQIPVYDVCDETCYYPFKCYYNYLSGLGNIIYY